ncbi:MAG: single-stranded DNA-binding protein [Muribaculaceae bacterium]|nr:single-stranded DNA-binding protein [Muribaculaceae bacterium]
MSVNKVILLGNAGKDPVVRDVQGVKVAEFTLATTDRAYTNAQGMQVPERTEWHNIVMWRGNADVAERYVRKGSKLYIEGKLNTRMWEKDGQKHYTTSIIVDRFELLDRRQDAPQQAAQQPMAQQAYQQPRPVAQTQSYSPQPQQPAPMPAAQPQYQQPVQQPMQAPAYQAQQYQQSPQTYQGPGVNDLPFNQ